MDTLWLKQILTNTHEKTQRVVQSESNPIFHLRNLCRFFLRMDVMIWETEKSIYVCDVWCVWRLRCRGGGGGGGGGLDINRFMDIAL